MSAITNYNFATNWKTHVSPHLNNSSELQTVLKKCWGLWKKGYAYKHQKRYLKSQSPGEIFAGGDGFVHFVDTLYKRVTRDERSILPEEHVRILEAIDAKGKDYDFTDDDYDNRQKIKDHILQIKGYKWPSTQQPRLFVPFGSCHTFNPTFGLWLANKVLPDGEWTVRGRDVHTTVYSEKLKMVFDILYFFTKDNRLEAYEAGTYDETKDPDQSFGGEAAFRDCALGPREYAKQIAEMDALTAEAFKAADKRRAAEAEQSSAIATESKQSSAVVADTKQSSLPPAQANATPASENAPPQKDLQPPAIPSRVLRSSTKKRSASAITPKIESKSKQ
jgi:hypothetical protein